MFSCRITLKIILGNNELKSDIFSFFLSFFLYIIISLLFTLPQYRTYTPGLTTQIPVGQMPVGGAILYGLEHYTDTQGRASVNVWPAQCQGSRRRHHRTEHEGQKPNSRVGIKFPDPAGNRTWAAGLEGRDSTDHATATD